MEVGVQLEVRRWGGEAAAVGLAAVANAAAGAVA